MFEQGGRGQRQGPEIQLEEILRGIGSGINAAMQRLGGGGVKLVVMALLALAIIVWLATGVFQVGPREQAGLQLFGEFQETRGPGLQWYFPPPIGKKTIVDVEVTRSMELGFFTTPTGAISDQAGEALMITGDLNIVNVQLVVQYRISDLEKYLFRVDDPGEALRGIGRGNPEGRTLKDATEMALRQVVGRRSYDDIFVIRKEEVQDATEQLLQQTLDDYDTGIMITELKLQTVRPPDQVRAAFDDVVSARVDKESRINEANAFKQSQIPRAEGAAQQTVQAAEAFKAERIALAVGETARFRSVLEAYLKAPDITRQRLYLEAMEEILPGIKKFILASDSSSNLLQFLPLDGDGGTTR
jgi:membrane protease subunit HflK